MPEPSVDHVVEQFRDQITENDIALIDAINKRVTLVRRLHAYKVEKGIDLSDPAREDWIVQYLQRCNRGPLAADELAGFVREILDLTRREVERLRGAEPART